MNEIKEVMDFFSIDETKAKHLISEGFDISRVKPEVAVKTGTSELEDIKSNFIKESNEVKEEIEQEIFNQKAYQNHQQ